MEKLDTLLKFVSGKKEQKLRDSITEIFKKYYVNSNIVDDTINGIYLAIISYGLEEEELGYDGTSDFIFGRISCGALNKKF